MVQVGDERMTVQQFLYLNGANLAACPDAEIAFTIPPWHPSDETKDALRGIVNAGSVSFAALVLKNPTMAKAVGTVAGTVAAGWLTRHLDQGGRMGVVKIRDLMGYD